MLNLNDLIPAKAPVETTIGTLYVRHERTSDREYFKADDSQELGRLAVLRLCGRVEDKRDREPLLNEELQALREEDFLAIVPVLAKQGGLGEMSPGAGLKELGDAMKAARQREVESYQKKLGDMRKSIDSSYRFLGMNELGKLQEQMAGISALQGISSARDGLGSALLNNSVLDRALAGTSLAEHAARMAGVTGLQKGLSDIASASSVTRAAGLPEGLQQGTLSGIQAAQEATRLYGLSADTIDSTGVKAVNNLRVPHITRPEDSVLGRATLESAENSRQVVEHMGALTSIIAGLNQSLVQVVLPAWFQKVEEDQKSATVAFNQAASGLRWTRWAVIASFVITFATAGWQVWVSRDIDQGNAQQQARAEKLLREQLNAQQKMIEQQARDAAEMREVITALKLSRPVATTKDSQRR